jgi:hypothetical protein
LIIKNKYMIFALADMAVRHPWRRTAIREMFNTIKSIRYGEIFDSRQ